MDPFIGEIGLFPYSFAPQGWAACDGRELPISNHQMLFSLVGTQFGGNGTTKFALPNLPPHVTSGGGTVSYCIALDGIYPPRP